MKVTILGCGTSTGVPKIGNDWGACDPEEPRNARLRSSILVESAGERLLVDCGPDLRQQLLAAEVGSLTGVIVTHDHGDHVHGIDDLRPISQAIGGPVPLYSRAEVLDGLRQRFAYAFESSQAGTGRIEIADAAPPSRVTMRLTMIKPLAADNRVHFILQPQGDMTRVTWAMDGDVPFVGKLIHLFVDMDRMVGQEFANGLAELKVKAER